MAAESVNREEWTVIDSTAELRILFSGGIESAVLVGEAIEAGLKPIPVYVATGARWETAELGSAKVYLETLEVGLSDKMMIRESISGDVEEHWAYNEGVFPFAEEDVQMLEISGRNETLLREAVRFRRDDQNVILAIGTTVDNHFKDGDRQYFDTMETMLSAEMEAEVTILAPLIELTKSDVIKRGRRFPLGLTLSCIAPFDGKACGDCIKCGLRASAFINTGVIDKYEQEEVDESYGWR